MVATRRPPASRTVCTGATASVAEGSFVASYTDQCPFNLHWAQVVADDLRAAGHDAEVRRLDTVDAAQAVASPLGTYGLTRGDGLACHHLTSTKATERMLGKL